MTAPSRLLFKTSALAIAAALMVGSLGTPATASAQSTGDEEMEDKSRDMGNPVTARIRAAKERRARANQEAGAEQAGSSEQKGAAAPLYPLATRVAPSQKVNAKESKTAKEVQADYEANKYDAVFAKVDAFAASGSTNAYLQAYLYQLAAVAANNAGDQQKSAAYFRKAVDANGLDNNGHYQAMYNLAIQLNQLDQSAEALTVVDRFLAETKTDKTDPLALKAIILGNLDRPAEGAALFEKVLASKPGDRATLMNAVALYQQADNFDKANGLLEDARKKGLLTEGTEYRTLFVGYINANKYAEARQVLEEGVNKGAIKPTQQLANDYSILAQHYYIDANKIPEAIDFYTRAMKVSTDGEAALNLARVLRNESRIAEAKAAAKEALAKGVKKPKDANAILALPGGK
ncbi:tetratricopeptide repeat protein [Lysobacter brunescens]|uniref:Tetratricopeptide repeat protein n=1 Tax=Lysobacter brunescens TaxID=262323 RepID=A0ABW2YCY9_9GAMM